MKTKLKTEVFVKRSILQGKIALSGAKNSALRLLAASILTDEDIHIYNFPSNISDARIHIQMLECLGKICTIEQDTISILSGEALKTMLIWEDRSIRNTLLIFGALLSRFGRAKVPLPGGCSIGERKYDLHKMLLQKLGAKIWEEDSYICGEAHNGLCGDEIYLPIRSTGATENGIISGCLAQGITKIWNPHIRPEIIDLIKFLKTMGAKIEVRGNESIVIFGVEKLNGAKHTVIPDNVEALTYLIATVITKGDLEIQNFPFEHLEIPLIHLRESGSKFYKGQNSLIVRGGECYPIEISTGPYPGINSDMQPLFAVYGACAQGQSKITDLRFPDRFGYAEEMAKMGMRHSIEKNILKIDGIGGKLKGSDVKARDLRTGAALVLCGLVAEGTTIIHDFWQIERGYQFLYEKIAALGGAIKRDTKRVVTI